MGSSHRYTNRLIHEKSPYLLQHAHNPIDWNGLMISASDRATRVFDESR